MKDKLRRVIRCTDTLWLADLIIDHSNPQEPVVEYFPGDKLFTPADREPYKPVVR